MNDRQEVVGNLVNSRVLCDSDELVCKQWSQRLIRRKDGPFHDASLGEQESACC